MDDLVYDPQNKQGSELVSIIKGVFVFASGQIAKTQPEAMMIQTPVATIGIRGTTFGVQFRRNRDLTVVLAEDADGKIGEVFVKNRAGAVTLNQKYHATQVNGINSAPTPPTPMPQHAFLNTFNEAIIQLPSRTKRMHQIDPSFQRDDPMRQLRDDLLRR